MTTVIVGPRGSGRTSEAIRWAESEPQRSILVDTEIEVDRLVRLTRAPVAITVPLPTWDFIHEVRSKSNRTITADHVVVCAGTTVELRPGAKVIYSLGPTPEEVQSALEKLKVLED